MIKFLLVTCCLEPSRKIILEQVVDNIKHVAPDLLNAIDVIDNASSEPGTIELLKSTFKNVYRTNKNVGYWSAINWWLESLKCAPPKYTYIIESDMLHYKFDQIWECAVFLDKHDDVGSCRLHQYSVSERHLYDKDTPQKNSYRSIWQSHTNKITNQKIEFVATEFDQIWRTNFLTQLPALNRYEPLCEVISSLVGTQFSELDFQRKYWEKFQQTAILDGGIFHCDPGSYGVKAITSSWTPESELKKFGYQTTRYASITPIDQYIVSMIE